jgi:hypothetical protein
MRIFQFVCGLAVLFTTLAFGHLIHHFATHASDVGPPGAGFWAGIAAACVAGVLSLTGGCLLLRGAR